MLVVRKECLFYFSIKYIYLYEGGGEHRDVKMPGEDPHHQNEKKKEK